MRAKHTKNPASGGNPSAKKDDWHIWLGIAALGAIIAEKIVSHLRASLENRYPIIPEFSQWLESVGDSCAGLPLMWLTPAGFPVCQDKFKKQSSTLSSKKIYGSEPIRIGVTRLTESVSGRNQTQALLPNLIHSLDATHLAMTINAAHKAGIKRLGSIHDCLLCHPNEAKRLASILRSTFNELYSSAGGKSLPKVVQEWADWMKIVAGILQTENATLLKGALKYPNGLGRQAIRKTNEEALLEKILACDPQHQVMAGLLLDFRTGENFEAPKKKALPAGDPPQGTVFAIDQVLNSDYFFS